MPVRPCYIGKATYAGRFSGYTRKGMLRRRFAGVLGRLGRGAYMNVKISLKLSRTSSVPWDPAVE